LIPTAGGRSHPPNRTLKPAMLERLSAGLLG